MSAIDAVIFDLDGTLYDMRRMRVALAPALLRRLVWSPRQSFVALSVVRAYRKAHEALRGAHHIDLRRAQLQGAASLTGRSLEQVEAIITDWFETAPLPSVARAARPGLRASLERLRAAGVKTAVLSDYPPLEKLRALGVEASFDRIAWAQQPDVGALKPDPTGLLAIVRDLQVSPSRTVYVGDRLEVDAAAAIAAGCRAALLGDRQAPDAATPRFSNFASLVEWLLEDSRF